MFFCMMFIYGSSHFLIMKDPIKAKHMREVEALREWLVNGRAKVSPDGRKK